VALDQSAPLEVLDALKTAEVDDRIRQAAQTIYQALIEAELTSVIGAAPHQRTPDRSAQRNGHRQRLLATTAGDVELRIPKLRAGSFFPSLLERRRRVDQALFAVVMEAYLHGVSTRKVDDLVRALGADSGISKSEVSRICADLDIEVNAFRDRSLAGLAFFLVCGGLVLVSLLLRAGLVLAAGLDTRCPMEVARIPIAGGDAPVMSCGGATLSGRGGSDATWDSVGVGAEEPGGNSNGGSGGQVGARVTGGVAKGSPPLTTDPEPAEWVGISMSDTAAARPAAAMTMMTSQSLRIPPSGRRTLIVAETRPRHLGVQAGADGAQGRGCQSGRSGKSLVPLS
jgi:mutator family transposase